MESIPFASDSASYVLARPDASFAGLPILLVDDDAADLEITKDRLLEAGYKHVTSVNGGAAAISFLDQIDSLAANEAAGAAPGVVVVDIRMPAPDGYDVLARIKAMAADRRPLALAATGDTSTDTRIAALRAGASDFITKSLDAVELLLRLRNLAEMKSQEHELRRALERAEVADQYFRLLADNSADVIMHGRGAEVVWTSPSVRDAFGWLPEEWIGTDMTSRLHPDDLATVFAQLAEVDQGHWATGRVRVVTADGGYRWAEGRGRPYLDAEGNPDGWVAAVRVVDEQVKAEQQSVEAQARYQALFESAPDAMVVVGADGRIASANARADEMFRYARQDLLGTTVEMLLPGRFRENHNQYRDEFFADPKGRPMGVGGDLFALRRDGAQFPVEVSLNPIRIGRTTYVSAAIRDVTQLRVAQSEALLAAVVRYSADAIISFSLDGVIDSANRSASRLLGYPPEDIVGRSVFALLPTQSQQRFATTLQQLRGGGRAESYETQWARADGTLVDVGVNVFGIHDDDGEIVSFSTIARDITAEVEAKRQLERLAQFDSLTGLFNRGQAIGILRNALEDRRSPGTRLGVLFCDVDEFKAVNDTFGHAVGDVVLSTLATRVRECVRTMDIVGRVGGDEILVLLHGLHDMEEAGKIAEKIRCRVADPIRHGGQTLHVTVSIGATLALPGDSTSATTTRADAAMYESKRAGGNTVTCLEAQ